MDINISELNIYDGKHIVDKAYSVKCPYCGLLHDKLYFNEVPYSEGTFKIKCELCKKDFNVEYKANFSFLISK